MENYFLEEKIYFWALLAIPVLLLLFLATTLWKRQAQKKFAESDLLQRLAPNKSVFKPVLKLIIAGLILALVTMALVNPKMGNKIEKIKREGVDLVFAMDVSKSMLAEDIAPNRLEKSQQLVSQIINQLTGDRIGIIAYAGSAFPQLPITTDYASGKMFLKALNTDMVSSQGTAIGDAINLAKTYYNDVEQTNRVLVLVSDGEDHETGDAASIAETAKEAGITIISLGVGTTKGGPIPLKRNGIVQSYKKDKDGETVITRLNAKNLEEIAEKANGKYIDGTNTKRAVDELSAMLRQMNKKEFEAKQVASYKDQFQWFLGGALLLLFLDILVLERRTLWVQKLNLFKEKK